MFTRLYLVNISGANVADIVYVTIKLGNFYLQKIFERSGFMHSAVFLHKLTSSSIMLTTTTWDAQFYLESREIEFCSL